MPVPETARLVRTPLEGAATAADGALLVRGDDHPFALAGDWAGGGALVGSEPLVVAAPTDEPFDLLDRQPLLTPNCNNTANKGVRPLESPRLKGSDPLSRLD